MYIIVSSGGRSDEGISRKERPFVGDIHHLDESFGTMPLKDVSRALSLLTKTCLLLKMYCDGDSWRMIKDELAKKEKRRLKREWKIQIHPLYACPPSTNGSILADYSQLPLRNFIAMATMEGTSSPEEQTRGLIVDLSHRHQHISKAIEWFEEQYLKNPNKNQVGPTQ